VRTSRAMVTVVFAVSVVLLGANPQPARSQGERPRRPTEDADRHDCPGPWFKVPSKKAKATSAETITMVKVAGPQSNVPEFHDCQRFLTPDNRKYEGLYAVFATPTPPDSFAGHAALNLDYAYLAAEVVTRDGGYTNLKVAQQFNCLYLGVAHVGWRAFMVKSWLSEEACADSLRADEHTADALTVNRVVDTTFAADDYPPSARWDRTPNGSYFIVMSCGKAVCEIGIPPGELASHAQFVSEAMTKAQKRVRRIKPWYDEQFVAIPGGLNVSPTKVLGVATPDPRLGNITRAEFESNWVRVGDIALIADQPPYESKLGLTSGRNTLYLRHKPTDPDSLWWAMMVQGNRRTYGRVTRYGHEGMGFKIPATLRWRWLSNDETVWARCLEGCCQVEQGFTATPP
jgi:hypothetical protein